MIVGIGVDLVDVERFESTVARVPGVLNRLLVREEWVEDDGPMPIASVAGRFAAKEALWKALGSPGTLRWHDARVIRLEGGRPGFVMDGSVAERAKELGVRGVHLSISHDRGMAVAMVVVEG